MCVLSAPTSMWRRRLAQTMTTDMDQVRIYCMIKNFDNRARILQKLRIFRLMCLEVQSAAGYLLNGGAGDGQLVTLRDEVHTCTYALYSMHTPGCVHLIS